MSTSASSRVKRKSFYRKSELQMFCWFPAAILVHQNGVPIWRLHTKLYKGAWNVSANNSETVGHKDLRLGKIVYILVFYNISFSWLLPLDGFQFIFLLRDSENDLFVSSWQDFIDCVRDPQWSTADNWLVGIMERQSCENERTLSPPGNLTLMFATFQ